MQPLVSVIVPVYNVEKCLKRCLNSLRSQSLKNIEIILVDDASPDKCGAICKEYADRDPRFIVFHNIANRGLSVARNIGIENASAPYLMFVDSDDFVHKDFCKDAYECAVKYRADLVLFRFLLYGYTGRFGKPKRQKACSATEGYKSRLEALELLKNGIGPNAWNKLYSKELFKTVFYPPGFLFEDEGTTYKTVLQSSCIYYLDKVLYFKCFREGSITTLRTEKAQHDRKIMLAQQYLDLVEWSLQNRSENTEQFLMNLSLNYCIWKTPDASDPTYIACAKTLREWKVVPEGFTWKRKVLLVLFKYYPPLFELICMLYGAKAF